jgi:nitrogen PTS system EIIA component
MKLSDFIVSDAIVPELAASDRDGVIRELVTALAGAGAIGADAVEEVVAALIKREQSGSTGFGKGVAVPHVKHARVTKMAGTVGRIARGLDFASVDGQPVYIVVVMLSPDTHLNDDTFRRFLRQSDTREKIVDLLEEADAKK